jgi:hypothetical protein
MIKKFIRRHISIYSIGLFSFVIFLFMAKGRCHGYIMPAEQLIDLMAENFRHFQTLFIVQSTQKISYGNDETADICEDRVWFKAPDRMHFEPIDKNKGKVKGFDMSYCQLLLANDDTQRLKQLLSDWGVDLSIAGFTRIDGSIAYRIGEKASESPKLFIEKERFLPLHLLYRSQDLPIRDIISVHFRDYQRLDQGWYPYEITVSYGGHVKMVHTIRSIRANEPITVSPLYPLKFGYPDIEIPAEERNDLDEDRLKQIIERFEEKYQ